jgi:hypothetical protein
MNARRWIELSEFDGKLIAESAVFSKRSTLKTWRQSRISPPSRSEIAIP